jgi:cysteinyl-tRNA synthetase
MTLHLHNTLTRQKEPFTPRDAKRITMYVCGPTVYDFAHIGNARPVVVFDVLYRLLKHLYPATRVEYARNITDVDDKINARAQELVADNPTLAINDAIGQITQKYEAHYNDDMAALGCFPPDHTPRATEHIPHMIAMIETLITRGHAYAADGHVLFHAPSMPGYGKLSGRNREEQIAGARVDVAPYKRDPADFVLWKPSSAELPGWDSPWGRGRPGWHIECSAMSRAVLGEQIDIHGGGLDLIFPHHENEIAQSECSCSVHPFANFWLHNGYLTVNGDKMSKSLGNFFTVRDVLAKAPGEVIRMALLLTHYRSPFDWTDSLLDQAKGLVNRFYTLTAAFSGAPATKPSAELLAALADDLNTPLAVRHLHRLSNDIAYAQNAAEAQQLMAQLKTDAALLGLLGKTAQEWARGDTSDDEAQKIAGLITARQTAKTAKDFKRADAIRAELDAMAVVLEDKPGGITEWRRK